MNTADSKCFEVLRGHVVTRWKLHGEFSSTMNMHIMGVHHFRVVDFECLRTQSHWVMCVSHNGHEQVLFSAFNTQCTQFDISWECSHYVAFSKQQGTWAVSDCLEVLSLFFPFQNIKFKWRVHAPTRLQWTSKKFRTLACCTFVHIGKII